MQTIMPILIDTSLKGLAVLLLAVLIAAVTRKHSAAARHMVWTGAVVAVLTMPVLSYMLPGLAVLPAPVVSEIAELTVGPTPRTDVTVPVPEPSPTEQARMQADHAPLPAASADTASSPESPLATAAAADTASTPEPVATPTPPADPWWQPWLAWLPWVWLGGAVFTLIPLGLGWLSLWHLKRTTQRITGGSWQALLSQLTAEIGLKRPVVLLKSPCRMMPMTWGTLAGFVPSVPAKVLIPEDADAWSPERRRAVLLHELAHIQRRDCLTQTLTQLACALYWFNPLVWYAAHRMLIERERACDDLVLTHATKASDYARHLLEIATGPQAGMFAAHAGIAMARRSKLDGRLVAILDKHRNRRAMSRLGVALTITLIGAVAVPMAMLQAEAGSSETTNDNNPRPISVHAENFQVEFLGLAPFDDPAESVQDLPWWTPDGTPLDKAPYDMPAGLVVADDRDGANRYYAALRVPGDVADHGFQIVLESGEILQPRGYVVRQDEGVIPNLQAFTLAAPQGALETSFRLGVANDVWQTDRAIDLDHFPRGHELADTGIGYVVFPPAVTASELLYIDISFMGTSHQLRVVCVDGEGERHEPDAGTHITSYGTINTTRVFFSNLAVEDVHELVVQFRPYHEVEFRHVSLRPGHETEVVVEPGEAEPKPGPPLPGDAEQSRIVYITGPVGRPGAYVLPEDGMTLLQLIASADNVQWTGVPPVIEIVRQQPDGSERRLPRIRVKDLIEGEAENPRLQAGDVVIVRQDPEALRQRELDNLRQQRRGFEHLGEDSEQVQELDRRIEALEAGEANADEAGPPQQLGARQTRMRQLLSALQAYRAQHNDRWPRALEDVEPYLSEPIDLERYHYTPPLAEMPAVDPRSTPRMPIVPVPDGSAPGEARLAPIVLQEKGTFARGDHVVQGRADGTISGMGPLDVVITIDDDGVTIRRQNESTDEDARPDGGALQFRIVPTRETLHEFGGIMGVEWSEDSDFEAMLADATTALERPGAEATQRHDGPFAWFPVREELDLEGWEVITADHEGRTYLLVANREPLVMRPVVDGERQWRLNSASVGQDQQGRPSVAFAFDEAGGEAMRRLSSENIGRPMAVLLDGEVLVAPRLMIAIARRGQITGSFSDEEIHQIVTQLRQDIVNDDAR